MSDKTKKKKIDVRLTEETYREILIVAWGLDMRRSELLRNMILNFIKHTSLAVDQQNLTWEQAVSHFEQKMIEQNLTPDDISKRQTSETELPSELEVALSAFSKRYALEARDAFDLYFKERKND